MDTKPVSSIDAVARSRLITISADALLVDAAKLLSDTQISLLVACNSDGQWWVSSIGRCGESACSTAAADVITREVAYCRPTDSLHGVLSMMERRGFIHVPIVDETFTPQGVVNARDALRALMAEGKYEMSLLRDYVMGIGYR